MTQLFQIKSILRLLPVQWMSGIIPTVCAYVTRWQLTWLFINPKLPLPNWLEIGYLNDLEERILGVILVLLAISFLGYVVEWPFGDYSIVALGVAVGLVIFAISCSLTKVLLIAKYHQWTKGTTRTR